MPDDQPLVPHQDENRKCESCGFDLRGLTMPRCPECGATFDPAFVSDSANLPIPHLRRWRQFALLGLAWQVTHLVGYRLFVARLPTIELFNYLDDPFATCVSPLAQFVLLGLSLSFLLSKRRAEQCFGARALVLFYASVTAQIILTAAM